MGRRWQAFLDFWKKKCGKCGSLNMGGVVGHNSYGDPGYVCNDCGTVTHYSTEGR